MSSEGKNVRRISFLSGYNTSPDWSPKGDKIAYTSRLNGAFQIVIYDVRKQREYQLTKEVTNCENPSWSPDSRYLAFDSNLSGKKQLYIINANGKNKTAIKFGSIETSDPAWSPIYNQY
jgi:TolB protein